MNIQSLLFVDPPNLSDKTACEILDFLYQLSTAFENQYAAQIRRYYQQHDRFQQDMFEDVEDGFQSP